VGADHVRESTVSRTIGRSVPPDSLEDMLTNGATEDGSDSGLDSERRFVRAPDALWRQVGDVVLVRTVSHPEIVELFGTGVLLWLGLLQPTTAAALATELAAVVEVPVEVVTPDVVAALADLVRRGVVTSVGEAR
jgi:hypothetical protein